MFNQYFNKYINSVDESWPADSALSVTNGVTRRGIIGEEITLDDTAAAKRSKTASAGLYATLRLGSYILVKFKSTSTASNALGQLLFWSDPATFEVTPDPSTGVIACGVSLNAVTKGNLGYMQVAGLATVLFGTVTKGVPAVDDLVLGVSSSSLGKGQVLADATALTSVEVRKVIGTAYEAPASDAYKLVWLDLRRAFNPKNRLEH